jgi:16S rRNA (uracil1498-N3)-methyltransferase
MKKYVLPREIGPNGLVPVSGDEYHRLRRVLRVKPGSVFRGVTADGTDCSVRVREIHDAEDSLILEVLPNTYGKAKAAGSSRTAGSGSGITLFQGVLKGAKLDLVVRQATETGVEKIVLFESEYCQRSIGSRQDRWKRIIREAVQQSDAPIIPEIAGPVGLRDLPDCTTETDCVGLFFHQEPLGQTSLHRYLDRLCSRVRIVIGPEGGLSAQDMQILEEKGYKPVFLGQQVLRSETAVVFALGAVQIIRMESSEWVSAAR